MVVPSTAPALAEIDGLSALERARRQPMMLGLFLPIQSGGWSPSTAPRGTSWTYDYNAQLTVRAEELGFDLVFGLAQWIGKGGYGGETAYRHFSLDPFILTASLAALTRNIILISTLHVLYGPLHPLHIAKWGATIDHVSKGRWGINVVTGFTPGEIEMFGQGKIEHDLRYDMASEFTEVMERLWTGEENLTFRGKYWALENAFVTPKPPHGRPIIVNAASSTAGLEFAARYADLIFITSPGGAEVTAALDTLPAQTARIRELALQQGREVRTLINPHVICRETEREAQAAYQTILEHEDAAAVDGIVAAFQKGDTRSWRGHNRTQRIVGGNIQLIGSPEQIVDWFLKLKQAGCDGMQINFFDFAPDLEFFGARVLPLMRQAGLRVT